MKNKVLIITLSLIIPLFTSTAATYTGSSEKDLWSQLSSDEYKLPQNKVSFLSLFKWGRSKIKQAANRTLSNKSDILPYFRKLAHPNGICLKGEWIITKDNAYSGYFKKGSKALLIARASTAMSATRNGSFRAFGFAGKIFPTRDSSQKVKTANFFLVDDLGGTKAVHYTDVKMTNEPAVSKTSAVILKIAYVLKLAATFGAADSNPGIRQLYEVSELGEKEKSKVRTPQYLSIKAEKNQTVDEADFRDELNVKNYNDNQIIFNIEVASEKDEKGVPLFEKIGHIIIKKSVVSNTCDHKLHFHHPKWKNNLKH